MMSTTRSKPPNASSITDARPGVVAPEPALAGRHGDAVDEMARRAAPVQRGRFAVLTGR